MQSRQKVLIAEISKMDRDLEYLKLEAQRRKSPNAASPNDFRSSVTTVYICDHTRSAQPVEGYESAGQDFVRFLTEPIYDIGERIAAMRLEKKAACEEKDSREAFEAYWKMKGLMMKKHHESRRGRSYLLWAIKNAQFDRKIADPVLRLFKMMKGVRSEAVEAPHVPGVDNVESPSIAPLPVLADNSASPTSVQSLDQVGSGFGQRSSTAAAPNTRRTQRTLIRRPYVNWTSALIATAKAIGRRPTNRVYFCTNKEGCQSHCHNQTKDAIVVNEKKYVEKKEELEALQESFRVSTIDYDHNLVKYLLLVLETDIREKREYKEATAQYMHRAKQWFDFGAGYARLVRRRMKSRGY